MRVSAGIAGRANDLAILADGGGDTVSIVAERPKGLKPSCGGPDISPITVESSVGAGDCAGVVDARSAGLKLKRVEGLAPPALRPEEGPIDVTSDDGAEVVDAIGHRI